MPPPKDPEKALLWRQRLSEGTKRVYQDPIKRERILEPLRKTMATEDYKEKQRVIQTEVKQKGERSPFYKEDASYAAIHMTIRKYLAVPETCPKCGSTKPLHLSNKDHQYSRDPTDYQFLCTKCHKNYDKMLTMWKFINRGPVVA